MKHSTVYVLAKDFRPSASDDPNEFLYHTKIFDIPVCGKARLLYIAMARGIAADGAIPTIADLARMTDISEPTIVRILPQMVESGIIARREKTPPLSNRAHIPEDLRWEVWERDNFTCQRCGGRRHLAVDHVVPQVRGGETTLDNCQTLCRTCNSRKGARE